MNVLLAIGLVCFFTVTITGAIRVRVAALVVSQRQLHRGNDRHRRIAILSVGGLVIAAGSLISGFLGLFLFQPNQQGSSSSLVIVLDVSRSMMARDAAGSRLDAAKGIVSKLIDELDLRSAPHSLEFTGSTESNAPVEVGVVLTGETASVHAPLTHDLQFIRDVVSRASRSRIRSPGSNVSSGVMLAEEMLSRKESDRKTIVVLSDGGGVEPTPTRSLESQVVRRLVVGVGDPEVPSLIPIGSDTESRYLEFAGERVRSKLEEPALLRLCRAVDTGTYIENETGDSYARFPVGRHTIEDWSLAILPLQRSSFRWLPTITQIFLLLAFVFLSGDLVLGVTAFGARETGHPSGELMMKFPLILAFVGAIAMWNGRATGQEELALGYRASYARAQSCLQRGEYEEADGFFLAARTKSGLAHHGVINAFLGESSLRQAFDSRNVIEKQRLATQALNYCRDAFALGDTTKALRRNLEIAKLIRWQCTLALSEAEIDHRPDSNQGPKSDPSSPGSGRPESSQSIDRNSSDPNAVTDSGQENERLTLERATAQVVLSREIKRNRSRHSGSTAIHIEARDW